MTSERWRSLGMRVVNEFKQLFFMIFYLWLIFGLYVFSQAVVLGEKSGGRYSVVHGVALLNALVLAKIMLVAEDLRFAHRFENRALIYPILYKAFAFAILFIVAYSLEKVLVGALAGASVAASLPNLGTETVKGLLLIWALLFVSLIPFFTIREIGRVIGGRELWNLVFRRGTRIYTLTSTPRQPS